MKLSEIGEFGFIDRIASMGLNRPVNVVRGIGDDCAVLKIDDKTCLLVTTDLLLERVHFMRSWGPPYVLGKKSLAVNISDIAACGGTPRDAFVSIGVPDDIDLEWLDGFYQGLNDLAREYNVNILGGDTTRSVADIVINVALTGLATTDEVLLRTGAEPGNVIVITGPTGLSAAGCDLLLAREIPTKPWVETLKKAHLEPRPHLLEGRLLAESRACTAAIDISDGLSSDLGHICKQSGVGALIFEEKLCIESVLAEAASYLNKDPFEWVLNGGEDYVLLACVAQEAFESVCMAAAEAGIELIAIGVLQEEPGMRLRLRSGIETELMPGGWNHFGAAGGKRK